MNREDFQILNNLVYFDSSATSMKPKEVVESIVDYYTKYTSNAHRGDYKNSLKVDEKYNETRKLVKEFINAKNDSEIIFTSGCTDSLNRIVFGFFKNILKDDDEIILTKLEHASNVLPWFEISSNIKYIPLTEDYQVTLDNLKKVITDKTKVVSLAHITNTIGDVRPIKEICSYCHSKGILVVVDAAQSINHIKVDVQDLDCDFLAFSAHKMYGPTGIGILYGKYELLQDLKPIFYGGDMNADFSSDLTRSYHELPTLDEAGTQNIAGIIGLGAAIKYINKIGINKIRKHEEEIRNYLINELKKIENITIYNESSKGSTILFNYNDIFPQDISVYLDRYKICIRAGNHCAKMSKEELGIKNTCRISIGLYNNIDDCDKLIKALKNPHLKDEII